MRILRQDFHARVFDLVRAVPAGRIATYGDIARELGAVSVARHVGFALAALRDDTVPWHRIVNSRGTISFPKESERYCLQRMLLEAEGITFGDRDRLDLKQLRWTFHRNARDPR